MPYAAGRAELLDYAGRLFDDLLASCAQLNYHMIFGEEESSPLIKSFAPIHTLLQLAQQHGSRVDAKSKQAIDLATQELPNCARRLAITAAEIDPAASEEEPRLAFPSLPIALIQVLTLSKVSWYPSRPPLAGQLSLHASFIFQRGSLLTPVRTASLSLDPESQALVSKLPPPDSHGKYYLSFRRKQKVKKHPGADGYEDGNR